MKKIIIIFALSLAVFSCSDDEEDNPCPAPIALDVNNLTNTTASLNWQSQIQTSLYQIEYGTFGFTQGTGTVLTIPETFANIIDLEAQTQYTFYARVFCNDLNDYSGWAGPFSFVTLETNPYCDDPTNLRVDPYPDSVTFNHIDLAWSEGEYGGAQVQYGTQGFTFGTGTIKTINSNYPDGTRIDGLNSNTSYDFYVRNSCDDSGFSTWVGPFTYSTLDEPFNENCIDPSVFMSVGTGITGGNNYFDFSWDYESSQNSWEIAYVPAGNPFSASSSIATSFEPVRLTLGAVTSGQAYDFYIRANCGGTDGFSAWVGPVIVTAQ